MSRSHQPQCWLLVTMDTVAMVMGRCCHLCGDASQPVVVEADQYSFTVLLLPWQLLTGSSSCSFPALDDITAAASSAGGQVVGASADAGRGGAPITVRRWRRLASELATVSIRVSIRVSIIRVAARFQCDSVSRRPRPPALLLRR